MKPTGSQPPRLYGLAKVHKDGCPLRPVVSMPGSAYHLIAKKVTEWLSLIPECSINSNTKDISNDLKNHRVHEDECLVSFDVVSLYTNVPVKESILYCANLLFDGKTKLDFINKETFIELAELACCNVVFDTHDGLYTQIEGLAMGSSPAPALANGWMSQFDGKIQGDSSLYSRYMDDIICIVNKDEIDTKLNQINSFHSALKFTMEKEINNCLPFLDMKIKNDNGMLSSEWYRKQTDTGLTLNFHSLAPFKYKKSVLIGYVYRIYNSCSNWMNIHKSLEEAKIILVKNQYPPDLIDNVFHDTLHRILKPDECDNETNDIVDELDDNACLFKVEPKDKFNFFLNYRGKITEKYAKTVRKLNLPLRFVLTLNKTKTQMPNLKTPVTDVLKSNVVYKITCPQCKLCYVGQSARHILTRYKEHMGSRGLLKKHFEDCDVTPSFDVVSILGRARGEKLLTLEALFISEIKPSLNTKDEFRSRELKLKF